MYFYSVWITKGSLWSFSSTPVVHAGRRQQPAVAPCSFGEKKGMLQEKSIFCICIFYMYYTLYCSILCHLESLHLSH